MDNVRPALLGSNGHSASAGASTSRNAFARIRLRLLRDGSKVRVQIV